MNCSKSVEALAGEGESVLTIEVVDEAIEKLNCPSFIDARLLPPYITWLFFGWGSVCCQRKLKKNDRK